ncbi:RNA methyltransferase-like protein 1 [Habropoda laboriosa]|uniref:RNA methyltransferase-like protein 1 n=1 Tax=Habropoda laboriosa TaxID=597456 RepID=A0A0L7R8P4_9HYME|nr:RNA methyltransferase-like protein 1 [Habropoda laboriosa]
MVFLGIVYNTIRPLRSVKIVNLNITRTYTRWVSRRPVAILNEDELYDCEDTTEENIQQRKIPSRSVRKKKKTPIKTEEAAPPELVKKNVFTNLKENDKIITSLMTKLKSRKRREKANEIILEGQRLIKDAIKAGIMPNKIIFNDSSDIKEFKFPEDVTLYKVTYKTIQLWSSLITSPGLLGIFKVPDIQNNIAADNALPLTIICDNIREPGNLGSIMRVAAGVGCEKLIIMKGCVDLWDPKVLRSAAGTHFRLPIHAFPTWNQVPSLISENCNIFITDSNFDNKNAMKQFMLKIPIAPYYSLDYTRKESVIILSGETEGLSYDSYKFLSKQKSIRINVPLVKGVDSLNTGVALGIVGFEIKRQFLKKQSQI